MLPCSPALLPAIPSVAAISAGEAGLGRPAGQLTPRLVVTALLGLALAACLWWTYFGGGDDDRAERALTAASSERRTRLALSAYFYAHIPLLLGVIAVAAGVQQAIEDTARPASAAAAATLAAGAALFLAGSAAFRRLLRTGPARLRVIFLAGQALTVATHRTLHLSPADRVLGPGPGQPFARPSIRAISCACRAKPNRSMLAAIRPGSADLGMTGISCSRCHLSTTWAAVTS